MDESHLEETPSISKGISEIMPENVQLECFNSVYVKEELPEQVDNYPVIKLIKNENDESGDIFREEKVSNISIVKLEPEINALEFETNTNMQSILFSDIKSLDKSNDEFAEQIETDVKNENIIIPNESDEILLEKQEIKNEEDIKTEDLHQSQNSMLVNCIDNHSDYQTSKRKCVKKLNIQQKNSREVMFKCDHCNYKTNRKGSLKVHLLRHRYVHMFKCDHCDYQTYYKETLERHSLRHKNPEDVSMFKCDQCDYKTADNNYLKIHALQHKNLEEIEIYKCSNCSYETKHKKVLREHVKRHQNLESDKCFKCNQCDFKTLYKRSLNKHVLNRHKPELKHENSEDRLVFKCDHCDYQTGRRYNLVKHSIQHNDAVLMFKCDNCDFKTRYRNTIQRHVLRHDVSTQYHVQSSYL